jgi:hypothetical protein
MGPVAMNHIPNRSLKLAEGLISDAMREIHASEKEEFERARARRHEEIIRVQTHGEGEGEMCRAVRVATVFWGKGVGLTYIRPDCILILPQLSLLSLLSFPYVDV